MTTAAAFDLPIAIEIAEDVIPFDSRLPWPRCVPSTSEAERALFDGSEVPKALELAHRRFLNKLSADARAHFGAEAKGAMAAWRNALAVAWRLEMAGALPSGSAQDEEALQNMFGQAAEVRAALTTAKTSGAAAALTATIPEVEAMLLAAWDKLIRRASPVEHTPPGGYRALSRPSTGSFPAVGKARGTSGVRAAENVAPAPKPSASVAATPANGQRWLTAVLMFALAAAAIGWSFGHSDKARYAGGGVPNGWVLAGDLGEGLATLMPANPDKPGSDVETQEFLETSRRRGFTVTSPAPHEFRLVRFNPSR